MNLVLQKGNQAYEKYQEQEAPLSTTLQENLTGVRVVKAFARQDYEMGKFEKDNFEKFLRGKHLLLDALALLAALGRGAGLSNVVSRFCLRSRPWPSTARSRWARTWPTRD